MSMVHSCNFTPLMSYLSVTVRHLMGALKYLSEDGVVER